MLAFRTVTYCTENEETPLRGFQRLSDAHRAYGPSRWACGLPAGLVALPRADRKPGSAGDGVDSFGTTRPTMTLEGPLLTLEGPTMPAHY